MGLGAKTATLLHLSSQEDPSSVIKEEEIESDLIEVNDVLKVSLVTCHLPSVTPGHVTLTPRA